MRFVETSSRWGNLYRRRYYVNGRRVTESEFDSRIAPHLAAHPHASMAGRVENAGGLHRAIWDFPEAL